MLLPVRTLFAHQWLTLPDYILRAYPKDVADHMEWIVDWINPLVVFVGTPLITAMTRKPPRLHDDDHGHARLRAPDLLPVRRPIALHAHRVSGDFFDRRIDVVGAISRVRRGARARRTSLRNTWVSRTCRGSSRRARRVSTRARYYIATCPSTARFTRRRCGSSTASRDSRVADRALARARVGDEGARREASLGELTEDGSVRDVWVSRARGACRSDRARCESRRRRCRRSARCRAHIETALVAAVPSSHVHAFAPVSNARPIHTSRPLVGTAMFG